MQAISDNFFSFLTSGLFEFHIPIYQRSYVWTTSHCKRLYNDIINVFQNRARTHFFGSIIIQGQDDADVYQIIDGQQRLTTICIFLLALRNVMLDHRGENNAFHEKYFDPNQPGPKVSALNRALEVETNTARLRLQSEADNFSVYQSIFNRTQETQNCKKNSILKNYLYFCREIYRDLVSNKYSFDNVISKLRHLSFAKVTLDNDDDPQTIFDCMNSTGEDLKPGDNIRNFIFMAIRNATTQQYLYQSYWLPIISNISSAVSTNNEFTEFIHTWLKYKTHNKVVKNNLYESFIKYVNENFKNDDGNGINHNRLFEELFNKSKIYKVINNGYGTKELFLSISNDQSNELDQIFKRLNFIGIKQYYCFALSLISACLENDISFDEVLSIFRYFESYIFRGIVCKYRANKYENLFPCLYRMIDNFKKQNSTTYTNAFFNIVTFDNTFTQRAIAFPSDQKFKNAFIEDFSYSDGLKIKYALDRINARLEADATKAPNELYINSTLNNNDISIEHIFPQNPEPIWKRLLNNDYIICERLLHNIGNLTLTGYNTKCSNKSFEFKKSLSEGGFNVSALALNHPNSLNVNDLTNFYTPIADYEKWGSTEISRRADQLGSLAIDIWPSPDNVEIPETVIARSLTLSDNDNSFTGQTFKSIHIELPDETTVDFDVHTMAECFSNILRALNDSDSYDLSQIFNDESQTFIRKIISFNQNGDLEIYTGSSNEQKIKNLRKIFDYYKIDYKEDDPVTFYLADE